VTSSSVPVQYVSSWIRSSPCSYLVLQNQVSGPAVSQDPSSEFTDLFLLKRDILDQ
jgi:hypothetical protein